MFGKAFYGIAILSAIIALGMFSVFTFAQSPAFYNCYWLNGCSRLDSSGSNTLYADSQPLLLSATKEVGDFARRLRYQVWSKPVETFLPTIEVKEPNNNILAKVSVPASYIAEAMKEVGGIAGPTGLFLWKFVSPELAVIITLLTIVGILSGYIIGMKHGLTKGLARHFHIR